MHKPTFQIHTKFSNQIWLSVSRSGIIAVMNYTVERAYQC